MTRGPGAAAAAALPRDTAVRELGTRTPSVRGVTPAAAALTPGQPHAQVYTRSLHVMGETVRPAASFLLHSGTGRGGRCLSSQPGQTGRGRTCGSVARPPAA